MGGPCATLSGGLGQSLLGWLQGSGMYVVKYRARPRPVLPDLADPSLTGETEKEGYGDVQGLGMPALQGSG